MKGRDWIKCLNNTEEDNFLCNLREFRGDDDIEYFLDEVYLDFFAFISGAFPWGQTPEGGRYWHMIAERNPVVSKYRMDRFKFV